MMSIRDLGCVFAPTFFRGPSPDSRLNARQAMELTNNSLYLFERLVALYNLGLRENNAGTIVIGGDEETKVEEAKVEEAKVEERKIDMEECVEGEGEAVEGKIDGQSGEGVASPEGKDGEQESKQEGQAESVEAVQPGGEPDE